MSKLKDDWQVLRLGSRRDFVTIAAITATLILIVALNLYFVFSLTAG